MAIQKKAKIKISSPKTAKFPPPPFTYVSGTKSMRMTIPPGSTVYVLGKDGEYPDALKELLGEEERKGYLSGHADTIAGIKNKQVDTGQRSPDELAKYMLTQMFGYDAAARNKILAKVIDGCKSLLDEKMASRDFDVKNAEREFDDAKKLSEELAGILTGQIQFK